MRLSWHTDLSGNFDGNLGDKVLKVFSMLRHFAQNGIDFLTTKISIFGEQISLWTLLVTGGLITLLVAIIIKKVTPLA